MRMSILAEYMYVYHTQTWYLGRPQEDVGFPGSRVTDVCETPSAGTKLRSSIGTSTLATQQSLQPAAFSLHSPLSRNMYMYVCATCVHACRGQGVGDSQQLESQAVVSSPTWVLGIELGSSVRVIYTLNHRAIFPVLGNYALFLSVKEREAKMYMYTYKHILLFI